MSLHSLRVHRNSLLQRPIDPIQRTRPTCFETFLYVLLYSPRLGLINGARGGTKNGLFQVLFTSAAKEEQGRETPSRPVSGFHRKWDRWRFTENGQLSGFLRGNYCSYFMSFLLMDSRFCIHICVWYLMNLVLALLFFFNRLMIFFKGLGFTTVCALCACLHLSSAVFFFL